jgi:agmatine deiminase
MNSVKKKNLAQPPFYFMPAEWEPHRGTLIAWPTNQETWEGNEIPVQEDMAVLASLLSQVEDVFIATKSSDNTKKISESIAAKNGNPSRVYFPLVSNNDCWMRDAGPNYVWSRQKPFAAAINNWRYNAWGGKYPPWDEDTTIKTKFSRWIGCENLFEPDMILEGGSIDVNGEGVLLTTESCLLNPNRNPDLSRKEIEKRLKQFLGISKIIWLKEGISGDDTDGHIDDFARFVNKDTIVCSSEENPKDENFSPLREAYSQLTHEKKYWRRSLSRGQTPHAFPKVFQGFQGPCFVCQFLLCQRDSAASCF